MQLTLKNNQLMTFATILDKVHPKQMPANRGRAKLFAKVKDKLAEYFKDESDILKEYCELNETGQFIQEDGGLRLKDPNQAGDVRELQTELANEEVILKAGEYTKRYMDFLDWLETAEDDFTTEEVLLIDDLLEQYDASKGAQQDE